MFVPSPDASQRVETCDWRCAWRTAGSAGTVKTAAPSRSMEDGAGGREATGARSRAMPCHGREIVAERAETRPEWGNRRELPSVATPVADLSRFSADPKAGQANPFARRVSVREVPREAMGCTVASG